MYVTDEIQLKIFLLPRNDSFGNPCEYRTGF